MGKRINRVEAYERGIRRLHDAGIGVYASFVFGYDYDDNSVFDEFLEFAERNRIDGAFLPILTPFPGTRIHQRLKQENRLLTEDWSKYDMATVVFRPKKMTVRRAAGRFLEGQPVFLFSLVHLEADLQPLLLPTKPHRLWPHEPGPLACRQKSRTIFSSEKGTITR